MGQRRASGEGAIYPVAWYDSEKKRPKLWRGSIELGYHEGKRIRKTAQAIASGGDQPGAEYPPH